MSTSLLILIIIYLLSSIFLNLILNKSVKDGLSFEPYDNYLVINILSIVPFLNTILFIRLLFIDFLSFVDLIKFKIYYKIKTNESKKIKKIEDERISNHLYKQYVSMGFNEKEVNRLISGFKKNNLKK